MKLYCYNGRIRPGTTHKLAPIYTQVYKTCPKRTKEKRSIRGELGEIQKGTFLHVEVVQTPCTYTYMYVLPRSSPLLAIFSLGSRNLNIGINAYIGGALHMCNNTCFLWKRKWEVLRARSTKLRDLMTTKKRSKIDTLLHSRVSEIMDQNGVFRDFFTVE